MSIYLSRLARFNRHPAVRVFLVILPMISWSLEKVETHYPDGAILQRFFINKNDSVASIKDSLYREFHQNGGKKTEIRYRNGQEHGVARMWYDNGTVEMSCAYENGKLDGKKTRWYKGGAMKSRSNWFMGKQEGLSETWFESGRLQSRGSFCKGKRCAEFRHWYENGQLYSMISFKNGNLSGPAKWYHTNGELAIVGFYGDNGEKEFLWQLYHNNGEKCAQISYLDGRVEKKEYFAPDAVIDSMFRAIETYMEK